MAEFSEKRGLRTQWSEAEIPECPLGEYPRPQFMRPSWLCLNGRWDYAVVPNGREPEDYRDRILVPFSPETALSGAGRGPGPGETSWYRRTFTLSGGKAPGKNPLKSSFTRRKFWGILFLKKQTLQRRPCHGSVHAQIRDRR